MENNTQLQVQNQVGLEQFKQGVNNLLESRDYFIAQVLPKLHENQDYYIIKNKKSLAKGGAEKLATIYQVAAKFERDNETIEMLGTLKGTVCFVCNLYRGEVFMGQGRGADSLARNQNDPNKTIKMAQKRAFVDAVIRATGLSDIFTQDLEDDNGHSKPNPKLSVKQPTSKQPIQPSKKHYCARHYSKLNKRVEITPAEANFSKTNYGFELCRECQKSAKEAQTTTLAPQAPETAESSSEEAKESQLEANINKFKSMGSGKVLE